MSNVNWAVKNFTATDDGPSSTDRFSEACSRRHVDWNMLALLILVELSVIVWIAFDHSLPAWDCVNHRFISTATFEQLKHPHFQSIDWYRGTLAISDLYPPLFYLSSAALKFVVGENANTELVANLFFIAIAFLSIYYITLETYKSKFSALLAPCLFFSYPLVYWSTHSALLDCAANAMVAFSLASFIWWSKKISLVRTLIVGIVFGATVLTKNNTAAFLIGPVLVESVSAYRQLDKVRIACLMVLGLITTTVVLPWVYLAAPEMLKFIAQIQSQQLASVETNNRIAEFFENFSRYMQADLTREILSPLFYVCFAFALISIRPFNKNKLFLLSSIFVGVLVCSSFRWVHQARYVVPCASSIAILTAGMLARAWGSNVPWKRISVGTALFLALFQFVLVNFTPYPIRSHSWSDRIMAWLGVSHCSKGTDYQSISVFPQPDRDWGTAWAITILEQETDVKPIQVMVMPNSDKVNASTYNYVAQMHRANLKILSGREYTVMGDVCTFPPKGNGTVEWYVLKSGDQGIPIRDQASLDAYEHWCEFIRHSNHYELKYKKQLPDKSYLELYRTAVRPQ